MLFSVIFLTIFFTNLIDKTLNNFDIVNLRHVERRSFNTFCPMFTRSFHRGILNIYNIDFTFFFFSCFRYLDVICCMSLMFLVSTTSQGNITVAYQGVLFPFFYRCWWNLFNIDEQLKHSMLEILWSIFWPGYFPISNTRLHEQCKRSLPKHYL